MSDIIKNKEEVRKCDFEKAELDQLRVALKRTYTERFLMTTMLYKVQKALNKATITWPPYKFSKK